MASVNAIALARKSFSRVIKVTTVSAAVIVFGISVSILVAPVNGTAIEARGASSKLSTAALPDDQSITLQQPLHRSREPTLVESASVTEAPAERSASNATLAETVAASGLEPAKGIGSTVSLEPDAASTTFAQLAPPSPSPPAPTAAQGVSGQEIRFGMVGPFSGPSRQLGVQMRVGIETAFRSANEAGGINGRRITLAVADDGYDPARTPEAMRQLLDKDQVFGFIGNVGTPTAAVALPIVLSRQMLFFGAFSGASLLRGDPPDHFVFNFRASYVEETAATVRYLVRTQRLKPDQIAVFAQQDGYGDAGFEGIVKAVRQLRTAGSGDQGTVTVRMNYKRNTVDVDDAVQQLALYQKKHPNNPIRAVVMVATYRAAAKFVERTLDQLPGLIYTNLSFVGSSSLAEELTILGSRFVQGVIVTQVVPSIDSYARVVLNYKAALAKHFSSEVPDFVSFEGYLAANMLIEGLRRAEPVLDTERLIDALEKLKDVDFGLGTSASFSRTEHQALHRVWGTQIDAKGKFIPLDLD